MSALARAGCAVRAVAIPDSERIYDTYVAVLFGDGGAAVARLLQRWGSVESPLRKRIDALEPLAAGELTARLEWLDGWRSRMLSLFADVDAIVGPVNVAPAPLHDTFERPSAVFTQTFNLTGWPSTAVRAGTSPSGLPIGVQVAAPPWREDVSLALAGAIEANQSLPDGTDQHLFPERGAAAVDHADDDRDIVLPLAAAARRQQKRDCSRQERTFVHGQGSMVRRRARQARFIWDGCMSANETKGLLATPATSSRISGAQQKALGRKSWRIFLVSSRPVWLRCRWR